MFQLKPLEESFFRIIHNRMPKFSALILCEGKSDAEIIKAVARKQDIELINVAITDCGGVENIPEIASAIASLARLSRRLELLATVIDLDDKTCSERFQSLVNSLNARDTQVKNVKEVERNIYNARLEASRELDFKAVFVGVEELPTKKHEIEDHMLKLQMLEGKISKDDVRVSRAKELVRSEETLKIIEEASKENVEEAFKPIVRLLRLLGT